MAVSHFMQRVAILILVFASLACTHGQVAPEVFAAFSASEHSVGFGDLWVGQSHAEAERVVGRALPISDDSYSDACGSGRSLATVAGTTVSIQWSDEEPREIEAMFVDLPVREAARARTALQRQFKNRAEICSMPKGDLAASRRDASWRLPRNGN